MKAFFVLLLACGLLATAPAAAAGETTLEVIPLKHQLAQDLIPILQPLVEPDGTVTGMGERLIVKATPAALAELRKALAEIDRAARRLRISVRQDVGGSLQAREDALSARAGGGDVRARVPSATGGEGARVRIGDEDSHLQYETLSTRAREDSFNTHFVQAVEGQPAWIATGQSVPLPTQSVIVGPGGAVVHEGIEYHDVTSGFYVVPRLSGDQVTLEIRPQLERLRPEGGGVIETQQVSAIASGRLGEWFPLGGADESFQRRQSANLTGTRASGSQSRGIWIKVDEIR